MLLYELARDFVRDIRRYTFATAVWNFRYTLGWRIGGFTSAKRDW
jgi:hypothetical protein